MLFLAGWDLLEAGVYPADDRTLAQLAMCTPEEWAAVRDQVAAAFDLKERPGFWIQHGLVRTKAAQDRFISIQSRNGKLGANKRWDNPITSDAIATPMAAGGFNPHGSRFSVLGEDESLAHARGEKSAHYPSEQAWAIVRKLAPRDPHGVASLMQWLWQDRGVHDLERIRLLVLEVRDRGVTEPKAYLGRVLDGGSI